MRSIPILALALALLAACGPPTTALVRGRVIDEEQRPVPGAKVTLSAYPSLAETSNQDYLTTDAKGEFDGVLSCRTRGGSPVLALVAEGRQGGVAHLNRRREPVTIVVRTLALVKGRVSYEKLPKPIREWNAEKGEGFRGRHVQIWRRLPAKPDGGSAPPPEYVAGGPLVNEAFEYLLPGGDYDVKVMGFHQLVIRDFRVNESADDVDLGVLEALPIHGHEIYGAPAPELRLADARDLPKDFTWASLRGKWVLLFLWDHRARANNWLPGLIRFQADHADKRDQFQIIAVHNCDDVLTVADLDRNLAWGMGPYEWKPLPFPVAIDDDSKTFNAYGIERGPRRQAGHLFLINPEGQVEFCPGQPLLSVLKSKLESQKTP